MKNLVLPAVALAALALGTLAQIGSAEARRGYRGGGVAYRGVAVRGPRGGVAYRGAAVGRGYRGGHYGYRRGYGVPLAVGAVGAAAVGAAAAGSYYGSPAYSYPAYGYPACDPYVQAC